MTATTVFPTTGINRDIVRWEEHLDTLTPVENRAGTWYKREDYFAPLGYGSVNGSKLRQLIHLIDTYRQTNPPNPGVLTGASVLSPQVSMTALVAQHFDLPATIILGGTKYNTAIKHENVAIALAAGADFQFVPVGYNPALQKAVADTAATTPHLGSYRVSYGITTPAEATPEAITRFHSFGADQTGNIPDEVEHLAIPAGSCNSVVSVLYGLARKPPANLRTVTLFGIGPTRLNFIQQRLQTIEQHTGTPLRNAYTYRYHHHLNTQREHQQNGRITLHHYDLHTSRYSSYQDRHKWQQDGIDFHPTYEGKMMSYIHEHPTRFAHLTRHDNTALIWIVGSSPKAAR